MILDRLFSPSQKAAAFTSEDLRGVLARGSASAAGVSVTAERALALATVFACVRVLAESVGQLPLHLYERNDRERKKATGHPLYSLLHDAPNEHQTAQEWLEWMVACLALQGNAYCQVIRVGPAGRQRVSELLPLQPGAVQPKRDARTGDVTYRVALDGGGSDTLPASEVLHVKLLPLDGLMGANPVRHAREAIGLAIGAEEFGAKLFANGAQPGGVLEHPGKLSEPAYKRLQESWAARHQGSSNAHQVALLEEGMKWQSIGFPASDAQFLETRKYQRSEIAGLWRVPLHLIGDLERATFSNIEQQGLDFVVHGLMPYLTRIEQRVRLQLLSPEERKRYFAKFQVAGLLRGDMAARGAFYNQLTNLGALSPNEIRELEDMNPREGGDVYLTPLNMAVNGKPPEEPAAGSE
jgi:HK97 family phage portal protein